MADKMHANFALRSGSCSVNLKTPFVLTECLCHVGGEREREEEREKGKRFPYGNYSLYFSFLPFLPKILDVASRNFRQSFRGKCFDSLSLSLRRESLTFKFPTSLSLP